jgi:hypothetical protein
MTITPYSLNYIFENLYVIVFALAQQRQACAWTSKIQRAIEWLAYGFAQLMWQFVSSPWQDIK